MDFVYGGPLKKMTLSHGSARGNLSSSSFSVSSSSPSSEGESRSGKAEPQGDVSLAAPVSLSFSSSPVDSSASGRAEPLGEVSSVAPADASPERVPSDVLAGRHVSDPPAGVPPVQVHPFTAFESSPPYPRSIGCIRETDSPCAPYAAYVTLERKDVLRGGPLKLIGSIAFDASRDFHACDVRRLAGLHLPLSQVEHLCETSGFIPDVGCMTFLQRGPKDLTVAGFCSFLSNSLGVGTLVRNQMYPIRAFVLCTTGRRSYLVPFYPLPYQILEECATQRIRPHYADMLYLFGHWQRYEKEMWQAVRSNRHLDRFAQVIALTPAGLSKILLIMAGIEPNPGPASHSPITVGAKPPRSPVLGPSSEPSSPLLRHVSDPPSPCEVPQRSSPQSKPGSGKLHTHAAPKRPSLKHQRPTFNALKKIGELEVALESGVREDVARERQLRDVEAEADSLREKLKNAEGRIQNLEGRNASLEQSALFSGMQVGRRYVSQFALVYSRASSAFSLAESASGEDRMIVEIENKVGDVFYFRLTHFPYDGAPVPISEEEIAKCGNARLNLDPAHDINNIVGALNRCDRFTRRVDLRQRAMVPYVVFVISRPHGGFEFVQDSDLQLDVRKVSYAEDANGDPITQKVLEDHGYVFLPDTDHIVDKQHRAMHAAPFAFDAKICVPDRGDRVTMCAGIGKRLFGCGRSVITDETVGMLEQSSDELISYCIGRLPIANFLQDHPQVLAEVFDSFTAGRPGSQVACIASHWNVCDQDFAAASEMYDRDRVRFFLKDEIYDKPKAPRFIACRSLESRTYQAFCLGPVLLYLEKALADANVKSLTPELIRQKIEGKYVNLDRIFETDFSSFEANLDFRVRGAVENRVFRRLVELMHGANSERVHVLDKNGEQYCRVSCPDGGWYNDHFPTIRFSGDFWTSIGNQISNIVITHMLINDIRAAHHLPPVSMPDFLAFSLFEGDDGLIADFGVTKTQFDVAARYRHFLLKVDEGPWEDLSFCGFRMQSLPDGTLVRAQDLQHVAGKLSVVFTNMPLQDGRNTRLLVLLQRCKALSYISLMRQWIPDVSVLPWLIEGVTRRYREVDDERFRRMYINAVGRISEFTPYATERVLSADGVPEFFHVLSETMVGTPLWFDRLFSLNFEAGGLWSRQDIERMYYQLMDHTNFNLALLPEVTEDSSFYVTAERAIQNRLNPFAQEVCDVRLDCSKARKEYHRRRFEDASLPINSRFFEGVDARRRIEMIWTRSHVICALIACAAVLTAGGACWCVASPPAIISGMSDTAAVTLSVVSLSLFLTMIACWPREHPDTSPLYKDAGVVFVT